MEASPRVTHWTPTLTKLQIEQRPRGLVEDRLAQAIEAT
jgi:hypothetical protein